MDDLTIAEERLLRDCYPRGATSNILTNKGTWDRWKKLEAKGLCHVGSGMLVRKFGITLTSEGFVYVKDLLNDTPLEEVRARALAKLTASERKALGLP